jgi:hypothetical protein
MDRPLIRRAALASLLAVAILPACAGQRSGWASRGRYEVLFESPSVQIRRGPQRIDPETGEIVIQWIGARAPDGQPALVASELALFDDRDEDDVPDPGEAVSLRESREEVRKILFSDVRVRAGSSSNLRARVTASTHRERCVVSWRVAPD